MEKIRSIKTPLRICSKSKLSVTGSKIISTPTRRTACSMSLDVIWSEGFLDELAATTSIGSAQPALAEVAGRAAST